MKVKAKIAYYDTKLDRRIRKNYEFEVNDVRAMELIDAGVAESLETPEEPVLEILSYRELQEMAKLRGIKQNQKKEALIEQLKL